MVVLRIEEVTPADTLEYLLRLYQWTDVFSGDVPDHAARIMEAVTVSEAKDRTAVSVSVPEPVSVVPVLLASSLPSPPDAFIGRTMELQEATALLGEARAVTLTGFGGTGKTRLSIELASRAAPEFSDGVHFVELAEIDDPDLVPHFVARSLGFSPHEETYEHIDRELASRIADSHVLMVLDNCEHVIEAAARLSESLLRATTGRGFSPRAASRSDSEVNRSIGLAHCPPLRAACRRWRRLLSSMQSPCSLSEPKRRTLLLRSPLRPLNS